MAIYEQKPAGDAMHYIYTDYLGSLRCITDASGNVEQKLAFDAWGNRRDPISGDKEGQPVLLFTRGFTGHEHLDELGLINMNGRVYDPMLGMFISPDNSLQAPDFTQNFNRYTYALNNPLIYTDPSGNNFWSWIKETSDNFGAWVDKHNLGETLLGYLAPDAGVSMLVGALFKGEWDLTKRGTSFNNSSRIFLGLFEVDTHEAGWGMQIASRFSRESPQTLLGFLSANLANDLGNVRFVNYYRGATVIQGSHDRLMWGWKIGGTGMTLGNYIMGNRFIEANPKNSLFQHEYGHVLQSRASGMDYLVAFALPSLTDRYNGKSYSDHNLNPIEQDANARALTFFMENVDGYTYDDWHYASGENPILDSKGNYTNSSTINRAILSSHEITDYYRIEEFIFNLFKK